MSAIPPRSNLICSIDVGAGASATPTAPTNSVAPPARQEELAPLLAELIKINREMTSQLGELVELNRRSEERFLKQYQQQRDEFQRWMDDHPEWRGRTKHVEEVLRTMLGQAIGDLVNHVEDNNDALLDSDYMRSDLVDRFGALLNHVSAIYGVLKRVSSVDPSNAEQNRPTAE